jgi:hypothetical protein
VRYHTARINVYRANAACYFSVPCVHCSSPNTVSHCFINVYTLLALQCRSTYSPLWDPVVKGYATATAKDTPDHIISAARHSTVTDRHWTAVQPPATVNTSTAKSSSSATTSSSSTDDTSAAAQLLQSYLCVPVMLIAASSSSSSSSGSSSSSSKRPVRASTASDAAAAAFSGSAVQCGWDIIAPAGWAAALLKACVFAGARAIGQVSSSIST